MFQDKFSNLTTMNTKQNIDVDSNIIFNTFSKSEKKIQLLLKILYYFMFLIICFMSYNKKFYFNLIYLWERAIALSKCWF